MRGWNLLVWWWIFAAIFVLVENFVNGEFFVGNIWELLTFIGGAVAAFWRGSVWWRAKQKRESPFVRIAFPPKGTEREFADYADHTTIPVGEDSLLIAVQVGYAMVLSRFNIRPLNRQFENDDSGQVSVEAVYDYDRELARKRTNSPFPVIPGRFSYIPDSEHGLDVTVNPPIQVAAKDWILLRLGVKTTSAWSGYISFKGPDVDGENRNVRGRLLVKWVRP